MSVSPQKNGTERRFQLLGNREFALDNPKWQRALELSTELAVLLWRKFISSFLREFSISLRIKIDNGPDPPYAAHTKVTPDSESRFSVGV
jgi:hypothetical protein